ncbi:hypothetical protein [Streptomyces roseochromogenus]|uniref:Secreted protein n=1 Tax=Streptomyces roseochromogenus subsp. oscitans DS 12.976 TaxID=1352936 RepID=V6K5Y5_STRRC|nr:hypothetical protein [Streptomyces roseochromogenus]EST24374.1 hypothetical protein M878_30640 [Streptomyces roseochromogenus subsp. oscitans DS 12.976]
MSHRITTLFILPIAALLAVTAGASTAAAAGVAHGDFIYMSGKDVPIGLRNVPTDKCIPLVIWGAKSGTNGTDKTAHIYATSDCHQQLVVAAAGKPGRGTGWNTPDYEPTAHSVWFECDKPDVC